MCMYLWSGQVLEGSSSGARRYKFRLRMDDGDFEEVDLPSPEGDVEIIPGFRNKFLERGGVEAVSWHL